MAKNLTLTTLNKVSKQYNETKTILLPIGKEEYKIDIKVNFKPTEVQDVISSFVELFADEKVKEFEIKDNVFFSLLYAHAIVHFSNLNFSNQEPLKYIQALLAIIDLPNDGFTTITQSLPPENWSNLTTKFLEYQTNMAKLIKATEDIKKDKDSNIAEPVNVLSDEKVDKIIEETENAVQQPE